MSVKESDRLARLSRRRWERAVEPVLLTLSAPHSIILSTYMSRPLGPRIEFGLRCRFAPAEGFGRGGGEGDGGGWRGGWQGRAAIREGGRAGRAWVWHVLADGAIPEALYGAPDFVADFFESRLLGRIGPARGGGGGGLR